MSERLPFPTELLRGHGPRVAQDDAEVLGLMRLGDRGEYLEAAQEAAALLQSRGRDLRLVAVYLAGSFVERGPHGLPDLLDCVATELGPAPGESAAQTRLRDAAMKWLCRALTSQIAFHTARRSETWTRWLEEVTDEEIARITHKSMALAEVHPESAGSLGKIGRWSQEKLGPATARARKLAAVVEPQPAPIPDPQLAEPSWDEPEPELDDDEADFEAPELEEPDDEQPDEFDEIYESDQHDALFAEQRMFEREDSYSEHRPVHELARWQPPAQPKPSSAAIEIDSPTLSRLCEKLRGFEILVQRGELDKAAIVASDIQSVIENFDPLVYLPGLFGRYLQLLSKIIDEVEARWNAGDSAARRVLEQFYRADLDRFIDE